MIKVRVTSYNPLMDMNPEDYELQFDEDNEAYEEEILTFNTEAEAKAFISGLEMAYVAMEGWLDASISGSIIIETPLQAFIEGVDRDIPDR
ncbi:MAG: hypothetical protein MN733_32710 [Nitrososphaera sp.]|nr:hypothetical protein [Nitrososphaera sp.]